MAVTESQHGEANAIERRINYLTFPKRRRLAMSQRATWRTPRFIQEQQSKRGGLGQSLYWSFRRKNRAGQGSSSELASLDTVSRLWDRGVVSSCLVPGPR